jgi:hypothetical protein
MRASRFAIAGMLIVMPLLGSSPAAWAQRADELPGPPQNARFGDPTLTGRNLQNFVYGVIKSVGPDEIVCDKTEFGDNQPFKIDKKTKFFRDGTASTEDRLKVGDQTWVKVRKDKKKGDMTALVVVTGELPADTKIK